MEVDPRRSLSICDKMFFVKWNTDHSVCARSCSPISPIGLASASLFSAQVRPAVIARISINFQVLSTQPTEKLANWKAKLGTFVQKNLSNSSTCCLKSLQTQRVGHLNCFISWHSFRNFGPCMTIAVLCREEINSSVTFMSRMSCACMFVFPSCRDHAKVKNLPLSCSCAERFQSIYTRNKNSVLLLSLTLTFCPSLSKSTMREP